MYRLRFLAHLGDIVGLSRDSTAEWGWLLILLANEQGEGEGILLKHFHKSAPAQGLLGAL